MRGYSAPVKWNGILSIKMNIDNSRQRGQDGETIAGLYLQEKGFQIITTNYHTLYGEIDIIARQHNILVFVEVKMRQHSHCGLPLEFIGGAKRMKIQRTAEHFLQKNTHFLEQCEIVRFDAISILYNAYSQPQIDHIENIFN